MVGSPNLADMSWVTSQYDRYVLGNTALSYPDDAGMIRVDEESGLGVALATDANGRYAYLDPYAGAQLALAEAYRNVAVTGATPGRGQRLPQLRLPENPEVMWQFSQAVEGLADACLELGIPVTGGNVSFYNQTGDVPIHPTPVVAVMGTIDDVGRRVPSGCRTRATTSTCSAAPTSSSTDRRGRASSMGTWAGTRQSRTSRARRHGGAALGRRPRRPAERRARSRRRRLAAALVDGCLRFGIGARVWLDELLERDQVDALTALFSESAARAIVAVRAKRT